MMIFNEAYTLANGMSIPKLGLGTWFIDDDKAAEAIRTAVKLGYRLIDTAQAYGNERGVGEGVRTCGLPREELFVASKVAAELKTYEAAARSIDETLEKMGLDYLDQMIIHSPQPWAEFRVEKRYFEENKAVWRALEDAQTAGKVRIIGVSNFLRDDLENLLADCRVRPAVNQILLHIGRTDGELLIFCREQGIPLQIADFSKIRVKCSDLTGQILDYKQYSDLHLPLLGAHQTRNCAVVLETLEALRQQGWNIPEEAVYQGIANTVWPGRFELLRREPVFIVDGGHNEQCFAALAENVKTYLAGRKIIALTGVMADKNYLEMYKGLVPLVSRFVTVTPDNPRSLDAESLADYLRQLGRPAQAAGSVEEGVKEALALAGAEGTVLAFGSLYMTGPIRQAVKNK